jgi:hypothetical protein
MRHTPTSRIARWPSRARRLPGIHARVGMAAAPASFLSTSQDQSGDFDMRYQLAPIYCRPWLLKGLSLQFMKSRIVRVLGILVVATLATTGCGKNRLPEQHSAPVASADDRSLLATYRIDDREILRTKIDTARNRLWVLGLDYVHVYDASHKALIRKTALPNWSVAGRICAPDLVLDRTGAAFVSSNVQSRLWRIDGDGFALTEHIIALRERESWDVGFAALVFRPDGSLLALTSSTGMVWRIDLATNSASVVDTNASLMGACDLTESLTK